MHLIRLSIPLLLSAVGTLAVPQPVGDWAMEKAYRNITEDQTNCRWSFRLSELDGNGTEAPADCVFWIRTNPGQSCSISDFHDIPCTGGSDWYINGGHSGYMDFMVVVVKNVRLNAVAFFGFSNQDLETGYEAPPQIEHAYPADSLGDWDHDDPSRRVGDEQSSGNRDQQQKRADSQGSPDGVGDGDDNESERDGILTSAKEWLVERMVRFTDKARNQIVLSFSLTDGNETTVPCKVTAEAQNGTDLDTWAWANQDCIGSGWSISWGYQPRGDAGIMTVVSNAFFGWNNISQTSILGKAGPNLVQDCACS